MNELQESRRIQAEMQSALEEQRTAYAQQKILMDRDQMGHDAKFAKFEKALERDSRD